MATLGERLAEARRKKGITQTELAVALGDRYTQSMISQVENGHSSLLIDGLVNAAKELNVATDYLLGLIDDPAPSAHIAHELSEIVWIRGDRDLMGRDGDVEFLEVAIPFSTRSLAEHKLDPAMAKTFRVRRSSIARLIPDGAYIVVDYSKRESNERDIFLAGNGHAPSRQWPCARARSVSVSNESRSDKFLEL